MNIIFPMLGIGSRFQKAGFLMPKYLLDLAEEKILYFVLYGFRNINKFNFIFLIRKDHNKYNPKYEINRICRILNIKIFKIIEVENSTNGQADSVRLSFNYCFPNSPLLIFNIDTIHLALDINFDFEYEGMMETFFAPGDHWSFAKTNENNFIYEVAEKKRISENCSNGLYYFKKLSIYEDSYNELYENNGSLNFDSYKENYIAPMYNNMIQKKMRVLNRKVDSKDILASGVPSEYYNLCSKYKFKSDLESQFKK